MQQLTPGTLLHGGTYKIEKILGQGSFGITYLAEHTNLGKKVAIKEFFMKELNSRGEDGSITGMSDSSLSQNYCQKFKKEAINLSRLDHPNIVRVTDSFSENGTFYYVMDFIEGQNLNDYIKSHYIDEAEAVSIIKSVADALIYMHEEKHMLHLDLKPGNVMRRNSDGHVFLIDFGLSKHYSTDGQPETSTTIGLGTAGYAPIEQGNKAKNGEFRPTIDVYALGATFYKLLTRETPPPASDLVSDDELLENKLREKGITGNVIDVVVHAMMPNVRKRTQKIELFIAELEGVDCLTSGKTSNDDAIDSTEGVVVTHVDNSEESTIIQNGKQESKATVTNNPKEESITSVGQTNGFIKFFNKYASAIMIIAGLFFVYDIICISMAFIPFRGHVQAPIGYGVLHHFIELFMIYTIGVKLLSCNKWYMAIVTLGFALLIGYCGILWIGNADSLVGEFCFRNLVPFVYGGLVLTIAYFIGIMLTKQVVGKIIFILLMISSVTPLVLNYMYGEFTAIFFITCLFTWSDAYSQALFIAVYIILLLAIALYFYSEKNKNAIAHAAKNGGNQSTIDATGRVCGYS